MEPEAPDEDGLDWERRSSEDSAGQVPSTCGGLVGRFCGHLWNLECLLELHLVPVGGLRGSFDIDGVLLEVTALAPDEAGVMRGTVRSANLQEDFVTFHARESPGGLLLTVDAPESSGLDSRTGGAEQVFLARLKA